MPRERFSLLLLILILLLASGCQSDQAFSPGRYQTEHEGQIWIIDFGQDGTWSGTYGGDPFSAGTYTISGQHITWLADSHCQAAGFPNPASYRWRMRGDLLTFKSLDGDPCLSRKVILEDETYTYQP